MCESFGCIACYVGNYAATKLVNWLAN